MLQPLFRAGQTQHVDHLTMLGEWTGHDPTNDAEVGEWHVIVGRGRDYADVPPIKGIVAEPAESDLAVTVEITRLA